MQVDASRDHLQGRRPYLQLLPGPKRGLASAGGQANRRPDIEINFGNDFHQFQKRICIFLSFEMKNTPRIMMPEFKFPFRLPKIYP